MSSTNIKEAGPIASQIYDHLNKTGPTGKSQGSTPLWKVTVTAKRENQSCSRVRPLTGYSVLRGIPGPTSDERQKETSSDGLKDAELLPSYWTSCLPLWLRGHLGVWCHPQEEVWQGSSLEIQTSHSDIYHVLEGEALKSVGKWVSEPFPLCMDSRIILKGGFSTVTARLLTQRLNIWKKKWRKWRLSILKTSQ